MQLLAGTGHASHPSMTVLACAGVFCWLEQVGLSQIQHLVSGCIVSGMQIPEDKRESYAKGQHLRGADAQNADRTRAEIVSIQLPKLGCFCHINSTSYQPILHDQL